MTAIRTTRNGRVGEIVFSRPEKLNALNNEMLEGLRDGLREFTAAEDISCIVLRGEGRSFSVGYDVSRGPGPKVHNVYADWVNLREKIQYWREVWECPKPVIASVHGHCMGGATMLAVCADITLIAEDAVVGWPTIPLGGGLLSPVSQWLIGPKRAKELSFIAGSSMSGTEAATLGWANHAVPAGELAERTATMAAAIARTPLELLVLKKRALNRVMDLQGFSETLMFGAEWDAISHAAPELDPILQQLRSDGLKDTIRWFKEGNQS
jgi:enoyl-CoA hydratase